MKKSVSTDPLISSVAFLRGINVGGVNIKMEALKKVFESIGLEKVKTLLASGNVLFMGPKPDNELKEKIEKALERAFGRSILVILRSINQLQALKTSDPFEAIPVTPQTRLYVSFLSEPPQSSLKIPYRAPEGDFSILQVTEAEIFSVLTLSEKRGTVDSMAILEKEFGKKITTRNWNTVQRVLKASQVY